MIWFYVAVLIMVFALGCFAWWRSFHLIVFRDVKHLTNYADAHESLKVRLCLPHGILLLTLGVLWISIPFLFLILHIRPTAIGGFLVIGIGLNWLGTSLIRRAYGISGDNGPPI